jgi:prepilin-type N-terminal cleavage/methylation domain-containing protein
MRDHGWTLTELLIALALAGVLTALAAPTFAGLLADLRRSATLTLLHGAAHTARRLAAAQGKPVLLCALGHDGRCSGHLDWSGQPLAITTGLEDPPLRTWSPPRVPAGVRLSSNRPLIHFSPLPPSASPATVLYCDPRGSRFSGAVILSATGRPRVTVGAALPEPTGCP